MSTWSKGRREERLQEEACLLRKGEPDGIVKCDDRHGKPPSLSVGPGPSLISAAGRRQKRRRHHSRTSCALGLTLLGVCLARLHKGVCFEPKGI